MAKICSQSGKLGFALVLGALQSVTSIGITHAQERIWIGQGGTNAAPKTWSTAANWQGGVAPPAGGAAGFVLKFDSQNNAYVSSNDLAGLFSFSSMVLSSTFNGDNDGLTGQVIRGLALLPVKTAANVTPEIQQNGAGTFNLLNNMGMFDKGLKLSGSGTGNVYIGRLGTPTAGVLAGAGSDVLEIDSAGNAAFHLMGDNTYSNGTRLTRGTLVIGRSSDDAGDKGAFGKGKLTLAGGTIMPFSHATPYALKNEVAISGTVTFGKEIPKLPLTNTMTFSGMVTLTGNPTFNTLASTPAGTLIKTIFSGEIKGNSGLIKDGKSILELSGATANSYTGATSVNLGALHLSKDEGKLAVPGNLAIGNGISTGQSVVLNNNEQIVNTSAVTIFRGASLDLNGKTETIGSLADGGMGAGDRIVRFPGKLTIGTAGNTSYSGVFEGKGDIVKIGNTRLILTAESKSENFNGTLTVAAGRIELRGQLGALGNKRMGKVTVENTAVLTGVKGPGAGNLNIYTNVPVDVKAGGRMAPGLSPGVFGIDGGVLLEPGSIFSIVLAGPTAGEGAGFHSQLLLTGGGLIEGSLLDLSLEAVPVEGNRYTIIRNEDDTLLGGEFDGLPHQTIFTEQYAGSDFPFQILYGQNQFGNDVVLVAVPEPASVLLLVIGLALVLARKSFGALSSS